MGLLHQKENTLSGLVVPSWLHCLLSNKCGSQNKSTTNLDHQLFTTNVSKLLLLVECNYFFGVFYHRINQIVVLLPFFLLSSLPKKNFLAPKKKKKKKKKS